MVSIENSIFKSLLYSEEYVRRVLPYLDDSYFEGSQRTLFTIYKTLFDKYNSVPTFEALAVTLQSEKIGDTEFTEIAELIGECHKTKDELPDVDWLVDETEQYCRDKKIYSAIYESINIIEGTNTKLDKHAIPEMLDDALAISFDSTIGMEFSDDAERRYDLYTSEDERVKLPLEALMLLSNGGLKRKSLSAILSFTNVGKSALMCFLAAELMKAGHDVLYITMEMAEELVLERVDANLLNVATDDLKHMDRTLFLSKISKIKDKSQGRLYVKEYPTSGAHAGHFRHLLKELKQKKKFKPAVVFIDYINICASSRYKSLSGVNSYSYVKAIAEELRGLAVEFNLPIMTATQTNRDNANSSAPDMTATSESIGLPQSLDFFVALTTDEVLQENGQQLLHLLKTRWGKKSDIKPQLINIDWSRMRYSDVGSVQSVANKVGIKKPDKKNSKEKKMAEIDWE
jgi:replicative DNA helicase